MKEFLVLIAEIFLIACIQTLAEMFIDVSKNPYQIKVLNIACFVGSLYLLIQFIFGYLFPEITSVINIPF